MKAGKKIKCKINGKTGISQGKVLRYGVQWILVKWDDKSIDSIILESYLEKIN